MASAPAHPKERINIHAEPRRVKHAELTRVDKKSLYKSVCPACDDGLLMMRRDSGDGRLLADDYCLLCGQRFIYEDVNTIESGHPV